MMLEDLGNRIRERREHLGLKQQDIAHALQVSPQAVSKWERGENGPDIAIVGSLARLLGVSTDWLLGAYAEGRDTLEATVFVSSVRGAYMRSLHVAAAEFAAWANGLFTQVTEAVVRRDGVPIKYMGDQFLAFFSGVGHERRACEAAFLAQRMVGETLDIGMSSGEIYMGRVGHPDYARPDIMGEVVNIAFLAKEWAEANAPGRVIVTGDLAGKAGEGFTQAASHEVSFRGIESLVTVCELETAAPEER